ncbi:MAG TPA: UDP-N-acetylglucosamine 4,6-dehydratase (inverting) [Thermotogota bacterium]|nr:UDP-N-acetylglucosamine 4,6-dehydratase (inverting) [Thermotogota bacterium]HRW91797.1 UDP-N-acetylglucosamine 4,6-dehydratase (inverting) [Thermotogota bacterium]
MLDNKTILITGGTGTFGKAFTDFVLKNHNPKKIIIFSRDEFKQYEMAKKFPDQKYPLRYFIGDIRDRDRLLRAFDGVDYVVHAAAMKQVPASEYNPFEAVKTNVLGAQNIVDAAINKGVKKVIALSTDKAVNPINLYGGTKMVMEKLMLAGNAYVGDKDTLFSAVRYGNVVGSRGSVIPFFADLVLNGANELPVTHEEMTRFWITIEQGVQLVITALEESVGGEIFVPKIPSMKLTDLARALKEDIRVKFIGIRPGEKIHETLISEDEGREVLLLQKNGQSVFVILPQFDVRQSRFNKYASYERMPARFCYRSDSNDWWLTSEELNEMVKPFLQNGGK